MPLAVLTAFFALIFGPTLLAGRVILVGDPLRQFYPLRTVAAQMVRDGHLPLWTPHILSGYPMSSMVMLGIGYPLTWTYLFLPGHWAEQFYVLAPYFLAPLFTYLFLRECGRSVPASVLGGLTFGYGGFLFSPIGLTGVHANSALWLPLMLLGVERARTRPLVGSLLLATAAYTMSVLAGSGQIFLYAGALMMGYAIFLAVFPGRRWQPIAVAVGSIVFAVGLAAFQMLQTWAAVQESVREAYPVERFGEGSFVPTLAWESLLQPLGNYWDSSTFVAPLALLLALVAIAGSGRRTPQVYFWLFVAAISWLLVLGKHTPLFEFYGRLPFVKLFRFPSRHTMEWTFAIGVLAAYGWDVLEAKIGRRTDEVRRSFFPIAGAAAAVLCGAFVAVQWGRHTLRAGLNAIPDLNIVIRHLDGGYLMWKAAFTLSIIVALLALWRLRDRPLRIALLTIVTASGCFVEPYLWMARPVVEAWSVRREYFGTFGRATQIVKQQLESGERTFSIPHPYAISPEPQRDVDAVNSTALAGFEDANGYESLILSRYSMAFQGFVDAEPFVNPDRSLFTPDSHVLDLLNVRYVIAYENVATVPEFVIVKDGLTYSATDFAADVKSDRPLTLWAGDEEADWLVVVTTLGNAGHVQQGAPVGRISIHTSDGQVVERQLLAGVHTSEMAWDRPDVKAMVPHQRAPIFDSGPDGNHRYLAKIALGERVRVKRIDFLKTTDAGLGLWKASLWDTARKKSIPLPRPPLERWKTIDEQNGVVILRNLRALPRAWLVSEVGMLDDAEVLRIIRGESDIAFDPRTTAFVGPSSGAALEAFARNMAPAPPAASPSQVRVVRREPNRLVFETTSARQAMLVAGEIAFPGWIASLDGKEVPIHRTNYLLRGVFIPAGRHTVEMRYRPPGARTGALVSLGTLAFLGLMTWKKRRRAL